MEEVEEVEEVEEEETRRRAGGGGGGGRASVGDRAAAARPLFSWYHRVAATPAARTATLCVSLLRSQRESDGWSAPLVLDTAPCVTPSSIMSSDTRAASSAMYGGGVAGGDVDSGSGLWTFSAYHCAAAAPASTTSGRFALLPRSHFDSAPSETRQALAITTAETRSLVINACTWLASTGTQ